MAGLQKGIRGGTISGDPMCITCRHRVHLQGIRDSQEESYCGAFGRPPKRLTFLAYECSVYDDKRLPSRYDMEQIAWILMSDVQTKRIGFVSAEELRKRGIYPDSVPAQVGF
jgi:hypothetical protein